MNPHWTSSGPAQAKSETSSPNPSVFLGEEHPAKFKTPNLRNYASQINQENSISFIDNLNITHPILMSVIPNESQIKPDVSLPYFYAEGDQIPPKEISDISSIHSTERNGKFDLERLKMQKYDSVGQPTLHIQLKFENVTIIPKDVLKKSNRRCEKCRKNKPNQANLPVKKILDNINGKINPCEFLAIIGASGAGKTTLLNYLSNKMFPNDLHGSGKVLINGIPREKIDYFKFTAFVQQDDILFEMFTVQGIFFFKR